MAKPQPLIDAHHHFWALDGSVHYPWLEDRPVGNFFLGNYDAIRRPFLADHLRALVPGGYHLIGSVHCEAEAERTEAIAENHWVTTLSRAEHLPCAHVGWAPLGRSDCVRYLDEQRASPLFRGIRAKPVTAATPEQVANVRGTSGSLQDQRWCSDLALLAERELSWDLRVPAWHLEEAAGVLETHPSLRVILNHTGLPWDRTPRGLSQWRAGMKALASNPNVAVKLSELGTPFHSWDAQANLDLLCEALTLFGPERCLFASNAPVSGLQISYSGWLSLVEEAIARISPHARQAVLHDNAVSWYRLAI